MSTGVYRTNNETILVKEESTYGTDPALAVANDSHYVDTVDIKGTPTVIKREGPSPMGPGWQPIEGPPDVNVEIETEIVAPTIAIASDVPPLLDLLLRSSGWELTSSVAGDPKTQTYTYNPHLETSSLTVEAHEHNKADDEGWEHQARGLRGSLAINIAALNKWVAKWSAIGSNYGHVLIGAGRTIPTASLGKPNVAGLADVALAVDGGTDYAGGRVVASDLSFESGHTLAAGIGGQRADLVPKGISGTITIEMDDQGFNPWSLIEGVPKLCTFTIHNPSAANFTGDTPSVAGNYTILRVHCYAMATPIGQDAGMQTWQIALAGGYPVDSADGGGRKPAAKAELIFGTKS